MTHSPLTTRCSAWQKPAIAIAALLIACFGVQVVLSQPLGRFAGFTDAQMTWYTLAACAVGLVYLALIAVLRRCSKPGMALIIALVLAGLGLRVGAWWMTPVNEDDLYRYMLDGAAVANGLNPFAVSPQALLAGNAPGAWLGLLDENGARAAVERVNHPEIRTIYPPVAQAGFGLAYLIDPWGIGGLRAVLQAADLLTAAAVFFALRVAGRPLVYAAVYWCCPLVPVQLIGTVHMDAMALAAVGVAAWALVADGSRDTAFTGVAGVALGFGVAIKLWPMLLIPVFFGRANPLSHKQRLTAVLLAGVTSALLLAPMALGGLDDDAGLNNYSQRWSNNAGAFAVIDRGLEHALPWLGQEAWQSDRTARQITLALIGAVCIGLALHKPRVRSTVNAIQRGAVLVLVAFFFSPTQFPWYATWTIVLLAFLPAVPLLVYASLIWLYYLPGQPAWGLVLQHGGFLVAVLCVLWHHRRGMRLDTQAGLDPATQQTSKDSVVAA